MPIACGTCHFGRPPLSAPHAHVVSAAFVLVFGHRPVASVADATFERAKTVVVPGCTAYCPTCAHITWLARHEDFEKALIQHEKDFVTCNEIVFELDQLQ